MSLLNRTFHPDEANQAFTTGRLLETGMYQYDPKDHHGPTLYYAAAAMQKAAGINSTASLNETLLRGTPVLFAVLTLVFALLAAGKIFKRSKAGWKLPSFLLAALLATSPIFVFFATDFIQEMLLSCFSVMMIWAITGCIFSFRRQNAEISKPNRIKPGTWALLAGMAAGLAFATKETSVITFSACAISAATAYLFHLSTSRARQIPANLSAINLKRPAILSIAGFALTATLFYSSFMSNWQGVYNIFISAPLSYFNRALGDAVSEGAAYHVHPWWQYVKWLFSDNAAFAAFTVAGAILGIIATVGNSQSSIEPPKPIRTAFVALLSLSLSLTAFYCAIPYKTPWCALQMHIPLLCAGLFGLILFSLRGTTGRVMLILLSAATLHANVSIVWRMWKSPDSRQIPYNYACASAQVKDMAALIESVAETVRRGAVSNVFIAVALPPEDTWPLPFYIRNLNANVGYWTQFAELEALAGLNRKPDIVIVPAEDGHLVQPLFPYLKNPRRFEMRHKVRVRVFW